MRVIKLQLSWYDDQQDRVRLWGSTVDVPRLPRQSQHSEWQPARPQQQSNTSNF